MASLPQVHCSCTAHNFCFCGTSPFSAECQVTLFVGCGGGNDAEVLTLATFLCATCPPSPRWRRRRHIPERKTPGQPPIAFLASTKWCRIAALEIGDLPCPIILHTPKKLAPFVVSRLLFSFRFSRPNKACAAWKWSNFLHIQVPRTRRILHLNFAESSIRLFYGDHSGLLVRPHDVPACRETCHAAGRHGSPQGNMPQRKDTCLAAGKHTSP